MFITKDEKKFDFSDTIKIDLLFIYCFFNLFFLLMEIIEAHLIFFNFRFFFLLLKSINFIYRLIYLIEFDFFVLKNY